MTAIGEARFLRLLARSRPLEEPELRRLSPMLILAPHQDDETLGCGGLIATASALGLRPRVAFLTDGSASHSGSPTWSPERLAAQRRGEAIAALEDLGVPPADVLFLDWSDARPHRAASPAYDDTVSTITRWTADRPPASLWSTWSGEGHGDHVAAAGVAAAFRGALDARPASFGYLVWGWQEAALDTVAEPRSLYCPSTVVARSRAIGRHKSQTSDLIKDATQAFTLSAEVVALTRRTSEIYLELP